MTEHYEAGREAYRVWITSPICAQFDRDAPADVAMRFFLPPVQQSRMQIVTPMPKERREWIKGFEDARSGR